MFCTRSSCRLSQSNANKQSTNLHSVSEEPNCTQSMFPVLIIWTGCGTSNGIIGDLDAMALVWCHCNANITLEQRAFCLNHYSLVLFHWYWVPSHEVIYSSQMMHWCWLICVKGVLNSGVKTVSSPITLGYAGHLGIVNDLLRLEQCTSLVSKHFT